MRSAFVVGLVALASSLAHAQPPPSPETWGPMRVFVGSWTGSRAGAEGSSKISRTYAPVAGNRQLQILERGNGRFGVWGVISVDTERQRFVLRQFPSNGHTLVLTHEPSSSSDSRLVFESTGDTPDRVRLTIERSSWDEFVERIERARPGGAFELLSEARFRRKV